MLLVLDSTRSLRELSTIKLHAFSQLTVHRNIYLKAKKAGGMKITFQTPPKYLDEKIIYNVLRDYKMLNCEVLVRDENGTATLFTINSKTCHQNTNTLAASYN
jgi:ribosome-interacting GTPase 1